MTYEDILAECIEKMEQGATVEECIAAYPDHTETLAPTLHFVQSLQEADTPMMSDDGFNRGRTEVSQAASEVKNSSVPFLSGLLVSLRENYLNTMPALRWAVAVFAALVLVFGSLGAVQAADDSLPGSPLYTVKRAGESVRGFFVNAPEAEARWHATLAERRLQEAVRLSQRGQQVDPQLLADAQRHIQSAIAASSTFEPGAREELQRNWINDFERIQSELSGSNGDDAVQNTVDGVIGEMASPTPTETPTPTATATAEPAVEFEFEGIVEAIGSSSLTVAGRTIRLTGDTEIDDDLEVGDHVELHLLRQADGTLVAREIEATDDDEIDDDDDDEVEVTETPETTETPEPTETPEFDDDQDDDSDDDRSGPSDDDQDDDDDQDGIDDDADDDDDDRSGSNSGSDDDDSDDDDDNGSSDDSDDDENDDDSDESDDDNSGSDDDSDDDADDDDSDDNDDNDDSDDDDDDSDSSDDSSDDDSSDDDDSDDGDDDDSDDEDDD